MRGSLIVRALSALGMLGTTLAVIYAQPVQLAFWNFNDDNTIVDGGVNGGTIALVGGTTATFATGSPLDAASPNRGYNTTNYPAQGTGNLTAGILFNTPTTGYMNITIQFDIRWSNTASKFLRFQYTYDGTNWLNGPQLVAPGGDTWWSSQNITNPNGNTRFYFSLYGDTQADNNPNFAFRILAEFAPNENAYHGARDGNAAGYRTTGTLRYDLVEVRGEVIPEPASVIALGVGLTGLLGLIRRRRHTA
ncbi:MAG: PEP-CTERM sorting domain-containing protein [Armatimonadota bacterium]